MQTKEGVKRIEKQEGTVEKEVKERNRGVGEEGTRKGASLIHCMLDDVYAFHC